MKRKNVAWVVPIGQKMAPIMLLDVTQEKFLLLQLCGRGSAFKG